MKERWTGREKSRERGTDWRKEKDRRRERERKKGRERKRETERETVVRVSDTRKDGIKAGSRKAKEGRPVAWK
jgi:hypothetical protein